MTPEQQKAIILAKARRRRAEAEAGGIRPQHPEFDGSNIPGYNPETGEVDRSTPAPRQPTALDPAGAFALGGPDGVPIIGPGLNSIVKGGAAALVTPFSDQSFMDNYDQMGRIQQDVQEQNPISTTAGNVTGAVAGTLPMMTAAPAAFGLTQAGMLAKSLASGGGSFGLGLTDAAVRSGGDVEETLKGGAQAGLTGLLSPAAAALFGKVAGKVYDKVKNSQAAKSLNVDPRAWALFSQAAKRDAIGADDAARLADLGDAGMAMDLGPNLQNQAGALAAMPGRAQSIIKEAVEGRDKAANMRIRGDVDNTIGPAPVPSKVIADIEANQSALSPEYTEVLKNGRPTNPAPIAKYLDREIVTKRGDAQGGMRKVRSMLDKVGGEGLETDPAVMHEMRKAIDGMMEGPLDTNTMNALTVARQAIDDELRASVPGIKTVDAKYAELARQKEAIKRGQQTLSNGREAPRPSELAEEMQQGALPQGEMVGPSAVPLRLSQGASAEIERIVGTTANDRVALQRMIKGEGSWNRDRLATLYGQEKADRIIKIVDREKQFADTSHVTNRNSLTAARQQAIADVDGIEADAGLSMIDSYKAGGVRGAARSASVDSAKKLIQALKDSGNEKALESLATTLSSKDRKVIEALGMMAPMPLSQVNRVARALMLTGPGGVGR